MSEVPGKRLIIQKDATAQFVRALKNPQVLEGDLRGMAEEVRAFLESNKIPYDGKETIKILFWYTY